jgi:hypothetical protein
VAVIDSWIVVQLQPWVASPLTPVTLTQALAWRMRRQFLEPVGTESVEDVVRRLCAVTAQHGPMAELGLRMRREESQPGEVAAALADGRLIRTFAFRGSVHLMTPEDGGVYLALRLAGRQWELQSWRTYYGLEPSDWPVLLEFVRRALADGPLTIPELIAAIAAQPRFAHLGPILTGNPWSVMKALAWHGVMSFGPSRDRQSTLQSLEGNSRWAGVPELDEAGPRALEQYFGAYGPATPANVHYWLGEGLSAGRKRIQGWLAGMGDRLVEIDIDGERALVLRDHVDELAGAEPSAAVRLLPAYDQWVLGPGTADTRVVPRARRQLVSRGANVLIMSGVVSGTWTCDANEVAIECFAEAGEVPRSAIETEVARLARILDRPLGASFRT